MVIFQKKSKRKSTGGRFKAMSVKRIYMTGSKPTLTGLGEKKKQAARTVGGHTKERLQSINTANVLNQKTGKYTQATITTIIENPSNRNYARRNIMTQGTTIETSAGKAKITNRPGQQGAINAVLIE